ncbi:hypothetical protein ABZS66_22670 [Dactylosporangium sp. NPDC005572]|uniref:hypothetical protein n=1 Tax=Dactylosporangium sp. NPDC005572 TaxID=3156889 RepID=UPI0033B5DB1B
MDERSRAVLIEGMKSLMHLGEQAMLLHDARYGRSDEEIRAQVEAHRAEREAGRTESVGFVTQAVSNLMTLGS